MTKSHSNMTLANGVVVVVTVARRRLKYVETFLSEWLWAVRFFPWDIKHETDGFRERYHFRGLSHGNVPKKSGEIKENLKRIMNKWNFYLRRAQRRPRCPWLSDQNIMNESKKYFLFHKRERERKKKKIEFVLFWFFSRLREAKRKRLEIKVRIQLK